MVLSECIVVGFLKYDQYVLCHFATNYIDAKAFDSDLSMLTASLHFFTVSRFLLLISG